MSDWYGSLPAESEKLWIPFALFVTCGIPIVLPLPKLNLKHRLQNPILHSIVKTIGSFACYYLFNFVGSSVKMVGDTNLMNASLCFVFYLIAIDDVYSIDDDIEICDGYLFAGFGLMMAQVVIPQWIILFVGPSLCVLKNVCQLTKNSSSGDGGAITGGAITGDSTTVDMPDDESVSSETSVFLKAAHPVGLFAYVCTAFLFFTSEYFVSLKSQRDKLWLPLVFFTLCGIPLLIRLPKLNLQYRLGHILLYAVIKSIGSFGCFYIFNWLGSSLELGKSIFLMNASLAFLIYLIAIDYIYEIDEDICLCDGYLFAGYGLMSNQKIIPIWVVICIAVSLCLLKNVLKLLKSSSGSKYEIVSSAARRDNSVSTLARGDETRGDMSVSTQARGDKSDTTQAVGDKIRGHISVNSQARVSGLETAIEEAIESAKEATNPDDLMKRIKMGDIKMTCFDSKYSEF